MKNIQFTTRSEWLLLPTIFVRKADEPGVISSRQSTLVGVAFLVFELSLEIYVL